MAANSDGSGPSPRPATFDQQRLSAKQARRLRALAAERDRGHRRVRSHDESASADADDFCGPRAPPARTLLVSSVANDCDAKGLLEPGDQLLALNGLVLAAPDEESFPRLMAAIKDLQRPLRATFVAGSFPHLSVEDDPSIDILARFSPEPRPEHCDDDPR